MRESHIETKLRDGVHAAGGICLKLSPQFFEGIPDRLIILPGKMEFVETKRPKGTLSPRQKFVHKQLAGLGHTPKVIDSTEKVKEYLNEIGC